MCDTLYCVLVFTADSYSRDPTVEYYVLECILIDILYVSLPVQLYYEYE